MDTDEGDMVYDNDAVKCPEEKTRGAVIQRHKLEWKMSKPDLETMKKV